MTAQINTVAFSGVEVKDVAVEVQISSGMVAFNIVGLPDKAVAESRERVRAALHALGIAIPAKRLTVNLAPADLAKEGSHYDLPIALGLLAAMGIVPAEEMQEYLVLGELSLDAHIRSVQGVLPAALHAASNDNTLICPERCGSEASWAGDVEVLAPGNLLQLINHIKGTQVLSKPQVSDIPRPEDHYHSCPNFSVVKGQETTKRALEIAAAGGHNCLMVGPPGAGKSLLASCMPGILPPLSPKEALEVSMIHSVAGSLPEGGLITQRPFRDPHHSASLPALVGGGSFARPGEISLAHHGVLFLDELPEFHRATLESLRQPLETGKAVVARANMHVTYPAQFQLIAAMNPCRCGYLGSGSLECTKAPRCGQNYQSKLSGPLMERIDIHVDVPMTTVSDLNKEAAETSKSVVKRVIEARARQQNRLNKNRADNPQDQHEDIFLNAYIKQEALQNLSIETDAKSLLDKAVEDMRLSARSYHRLLKVARTIGDLETSDTNIRKSHIAEALSYRRLCFR